MGCLVFIIKINSKLFPWELRRVQERYLPKFSATSIVLYCVNVRIRFQDCSLIITSHNRALRDGGLAVRQPFVNHVLVKQIEHKFIYGLLDI